MDKRFFLFAFALLVACSDDTGSTGDAGLDAGNLGNAGSSGSNAAGKGGTGGGKDAGSNVDAAGGGNDDGGGNDSGTDLTPMGEVKVYTGWPFDTKEAVKRQKETAAALGMKTEVEIDLGGGVKLAMVVIPAGESTLGCTDAPFPGIPNAADRCEGDEGLHAFTLPAPLLIGKTVITVAQFNALAPSLPDSQTPMSGEGQLPALFPYRRAQDVIRVALQNKVPAGWVIRMPTVDESEYAARAGVISFFTTGNTEADLAATSWYSGNSGGMMHEVLLKTPNAWNVHDAIGNAHTWVWFPGTSNYQDAWTTTNEHLVRSCPHFATPLFNNCRLSNKNISGNPVAVRFVADIPLPE